MALLKQAWNNIVGKAPLMERLPLGGHNVAYGNANIGMPRGQLAQLQAFASTGWLFSTVSRIAESVAAAEWQLYRKMPNGDRQLVERHPFLDVWQNINPFTTLPEFIEASQQHFELVGEVWWVILTNAMGMPVELQLVRPDRMRVLPSRDNFIAGYQYELGGGADSP